MSEIKNHYMRAKRKIIQEENFVDDLSNITVKRFFSEPNISAPTSVTQPQHSESNTLELHLLSKYGSNNESHDESNECLPPLSPNIVNSSECTNIAEESLEEQISLNLVQRSLKHNISHAALSHLLKIFKYYMPELLSDARSLLRTCRKVVSKVIEPGEYYHFGVENCVKNLISYSHEFLESTEIVQLVINIDGLPLAKSSGSQVYPILCRLVNDHNNLDMIGIYHGYQKSKDANDYLSDFVEDISNVINTGIVINNKHPVKISHFVCDAVAEAYITYTTAHMGYCSCTKCYEEGTYINNRVCFPNTNRLRLRTDTDYRSKVQEDHYTGTSLLEQIPGLDIIKCFPLVYMHLICLGVVKKLVVNSWCFGKPSVKLPYRDIAKISSNLINEAKNMPVEFNRKPRSLSEARRWKATEFRQFLFYTGPVVLSRILNNERYANFLSLHVAITILACPKYSHLIDYASNLLLYFVNTFKISYGAENISHNVHNLLHLSEDVKVYGSLDNFSAFPFENYLQSILKSIRKGEKLLAQIIKRKSEQNSHLSRIIEVRNKKYPMCKKEHTNGSTINGNICKQFKKIIFQDFALYINHPNNCCTLTSGDIIVIENIIDFNDEFKLIGRKFFTVENFYVRPCESKEIGIFLVDNLVALQIFNAVDILFKCVILNWKRKHVIFPQMHTNINC